MSEFNGEIIDNNQEEGKEYGGSVSLNMGKVFLWMGIGLAITALLSFVTPDIVVALSGGNGEVATNAYIWMIIVSAIIMLPAVIMISMPLFTKHAPVAVTGYFIYTVATGVLLSALMLILASYLEDSALFAKNAALAWGITAICFVLMGILGIAFKHMNAVIPLLLTLMVGCLVISLVNFFLQNDTIYWIVDFVLFGVILLITAVDMHNIAKISTRTNFKNDTALAIYCAYVLYCDFISILVRVLLYLAVSAKKN